MNALPHPTDPVLAICKAAADALRLNVLRVLCLESFGVMELCHIFQINQPAMSHHLKILATAGLLVTRREGNSIFYRRAIIATQDPVGALIASLFQTADDLPMDAGLAQRVAEVHESRNASSKQFFERNANRLKENQDLIAEFDHYAGSAQDLIGNEQLPRETLAMEIGPGDSPLLSNLASQFDRIIALDSSEEMLAKAKARLPQDHTNVEFLLGDLGGDIGLSEPLDLIVLNMVLHHMASPGQFFRDAAKHLNPGGSLFVMDLCPHSQDWAREVCGDLWLGFEPIDLDNWASEAQLNKGQSAYLGLKNGFQVQLRLYHQPNPSTNNYFTL